MTTPAAPVTPAPTWAALRAELRAAAEAVTAARRAERARPGAKTRAAARAAGARLVAADRAMTGYAESLPGPALAPVTVAEAIAGLAELRAEGAAGRAWL